MNESEAYEIEKQSEQAPDSKLEMLTGVFLFIMMFATVGAVWFFATYIPDPPQAGHQIEKITPSPQIDTSDWQTYRNEELGIELSYPNGWFVRTDTNENIVLSNVEVFSELSEEMLQNETRFMIMRDQVSNQEYLPVSEWFDQLLENGVANMPTIVENTAVDGHEAVRADVPAIGSYWRYYVEKEDSIFIFHHFSHQDEYQEIYERIVSSIKFIEPEIDTSDWQTYRNEEYGFELEYPNSENLETIFDNTYDETIIIQPKNDAEATESASLQIKILSNPENLTPQAFFADPVRVNHFSNTMPDSITQRTVGVDAVEAIQFIPYVTLAGDIILVVERQGYFVQICDCGLYFNSNDLFEPILSTFRFIEPEIDTSDWQTYRNEEYGFEFRYPSNWIVESSEEKHGQDYVYTSIDIKAEFDAYWTNIIQMSIRDSELYETMKRETEDDGRFVELSRATEKYNDINWEISAKLDVGENSWGTSTNATTYRDGYYLTFFAFDHKEQQLREILESFQFTEPKVDTSDWQTYRNEEYGFEFRYPSNWNHATSQAFGHADLFSFSNGDSTFNVIPRGEFDYGTPWSEPETTNDYLANKKVLIRKWNLDSGSTLLWYRVLEDIPNWLEQNRLDIRIDERDREVLDQMILSFKFIESEIDILDWDKYKIQPHSTQSP